MVDMGIHRHHRQKERAEEHGQASSMGSGLVMVRLVVEPLARSIERFVKAIHLGEVSTFLTSAKMIEAVPPFLTAYLTSSVVVDSLHLEPTLLQAALSVGGAVEDEARFGELRKRHPALVSAIEATFRLKQTRSKRRVVYQWHMKEKGVFWEPWKREQKVHLGMKLIELLIESTGMVELTHGITARGFRQYRVCATQQALDLLSRVDNRLAGRPAYTPTIVPPLPWKTAAAGGGYHGLRAPLVKVWRKAYQEDLAQADCPILLEAVNAIQGTAWRVNRAVLEVVLQCWEADREIGAYSEDKTWIAALPPKAVLEELPPRVEGELTHEELQEIKRGRSAIHGRNVVRRRQILAASLTVSTAKRFADRPSIYFPHQLDFRGRAYPMPAPFNPQGDDLARGLLEFAEAKTVGASGLEWLAIHGANCWARGKLDKAPLEDRINWVGQNHGMIRSIAQDPMADTRWCLAEDRWQFLAFCFEWDGALSCGEDPEDGRSMEDYQSSIPVSVDGSCNGLQHFSAMLRDPVGGAAVNLIPDERPHDVYGEVLLAVKKRLIENEATAEDHLNRDRARAWLNSGLLVRDLVKRPVMTLPYGCTKKGIENQIMEDLVRPAYAKSKIPVFPGDRTGWAHVGWIAGIVWDAMGAVVIASRAAMTWLQELALSAARDNRGLIWTTPLGFPVRHYETRTRIRKIVSLFNGRMLKLKLRLDTPAIDGQRMKNGIAPHFVHSLDASHLYMTVAACVEQAGITSFAAVHDSFGTHAADVEALSRILREQFVRLYTDFDPLKDLAMEARALLGDRAYIPPFPRKGDLEIERVLESWYFFA